MSEAQRESFILRHVTLETHRIFSVQNSRSARHDLPDIWTTEFIEEDSLSLRQTVNVCGVILPMYDRKSQVTDISYPSCLVIHLSMCSSTASIFIFLEDGLFSYFLSRLTPSVLSVTDLWLLPVTNPPPHVHAQQVLCNFIQ